jgi:hypothetical protein
MPDHDRADLTEKVAHEPGIGGEAAAEKPRHVVMRAGDEPVKRHRDVIDDLAHDLRSSPGGRLGSSDNAAGQN